MRTNNLTDDFIAIDTNVFEHLFNPEINLNDHIDSLLNFLASKEVKLIGDTKGRIANEYKTRLGHFFDSQDSAVKITHQNYIEILRYWFRPETLKKKISVHQGNSLMQAIKKIVTNGDGTDRVFVYVSISADRILITNDRRDIIDLGNKRGERRRKLHRLAKREGKKRVKILTSKEALEEVEVEYEHTK